MHRRIGRHNEIFLNINTLVELMRTKRVNRWRLLLAFAKLILLYYLTYDFYGLVEVCSRNTILVVCLYIQSGSYIFNGLCILTNLPVKTESRTVKCMKIYGKNKKALFLTCTRLFFCSKKQTKNQGINL